MNYGYNPTPFDRKLEQRLVDYCKTLEPDARGQQPYVEREGLYRGVRIRRLTYYGDERMAQIIAALDQIYRCCESEG